MVKKIGSSDYPQKHHPNHPQKGRIKKNDEKVKKVSKKNLSSNELTKTRSSSLLNINVKPQKKDEPISPKGSSVQKNEKSKKNELGENPLDLLSKKLNAGNAREILKEIKKIDKSVNTLEARLKCMLLDPTIETWEALTYLPQEKLLEEKSKGIVPFTNFLGQKGLWLPEIERVNLKIMENNFIRLLRNISEGQKSLDLGNEGQDYEEMGISIQQVIKEPSKFRGRQVTIARGAPSAGKTSFLQAQFSIGCDLIKRELLNHFNGLNPQQTHFQSKLIVERFCSAVENKLEQSLTMDALFLTPSAVSDKIMAAKSTHQMVRIVDLQLDFKTLCCRILKRGPYEPRMNLSILSNYYKSSSLDRLAGIAVIEKNLESVSEYEIRQWDGKKYLTVARFDPETQKIKILDRKAYADLVTPNTERMDQEIAHVSSIEINDRFISEFTRGMPPTEANVFEKALHQYQGKTMLDAINEHSLMPIQEASAEGTVLKKVLPWGKEDA